MPALALVAVLGAVASPTRFLAVEPARHSVRLTLVAGDGGANNSFNFDGYGRGELLVRVPAGWRVTIVCRNAGGRPASCAVVSGPDATAPAFAGATTPAPRDGVDPGASSTFSFVPRRAGSYRLTSLVPGEEEARMWDVLVVTRGGRPSISARPGP